MHLQTQEAILRGVCRRMMSCAVRVKTETLQQTMSSECMQRVQPALPCLVQLFSCVQGFD
jgi:hypothetical protein